MTDVPQLTEHLFRHEAGKLVSVLAGIFGIERLQLAEDVVQEALVRALRTWPYYGVPKNPAAWLTQTAKNLALDVIRREKNFQDKQPQVIAFIENWSDSSERSDSVFETEIKDDRLRMMFVCCHPVIPTEAQVALTLKTLCGFGIPEISRAFLTSEAAIAKRLTRAKQKIRDARIAFEIPTGEELLRRLEGVLQSLYLLFNEGYKASSGQNLVREELCREAIRLGALLAAHPAGSQPRVHALVALMLLNAARLPARTDALGNILRLEEQDRSRWDKSMIARGMFHLARSAAGSELSEYHLQAGIAAVHCAANNFQSTDWPQILSLYDRLIQIDNSPVVALNRAVAVAQINGPRAGLEIVESIRKTEMLESYYLLYAVLAEFESQVNNFESAARNLRRAIDLTELKSERNFLCKRLAACEAPVPACAPLDAS
ncbi:MAG TPA: sigma-70 family RNA polymerase sigma factor [Verrucomicrobiae bacterium]|nr:sigma-70 family RNA polymerase sigma factor [Verrucomicrobiae bacterium]